MKKKILIVDDEENTRWILTQSLENGYDILQASDGEEALRIICTHLDLVLLITDLEMPRMRGEELVRHIKKEYPSIKAIVLSGRTELEPVARAAGCDAFFEKPFDLFVLKEEVERLLRG